MYLTSLPTEGTNCTGDGHHDTLLPPKRPCAAWPPTTTTTTTTTTACAPNRPLYPQPTPTPTDPLAEGPRLPRHGVGVPRHPARLPRHLPDSNMPWAVSCNCRPATAHTKPGNRDQSGTATPRSLPGPARPYVPAVLGGTPPPPAALPRGRRQAPHLMEAAHRGPQLVSCTLHRHALVPADQRCGYPNHTTARQVPPWMQVCQ